MHQENSVLLKIENICKTYAIPVLSNVSLEINKAEIHAIVGENGAGKSTLCKIISGITPPNSGRMFLNNIPYSPRNKKEAERHGVRFVMQELNVIPMLTVAENIFLTEMPHRFGWINKKTLNNKARQVLAQIGMDIINPETKVADLGIGQQQMVEIASGISQNCSLLILDEPTAALTDIEVKHLFEQIRKLKQTGASIIYISHRLEEVMEISDRITVLRDGKLIATDNTSSFTLDKIVELMVGRELTPVQSELIEEKKEILLEVKNLNAGSKVKNVSFTLREGEILGFAGLMGSGRTETMRAIYGADKIDTGNIFLRGKRLEINSPSDAVNNRIAMLPENRKEHGLFLPLSVKFNITINNLKTLTSKLSIINTDKENSVAENWRNSLSIKCNSLDQKAVELSGGNQQKILLARWLFKDCDVIIMDEPTRGIDVGAKFEIYNLIKKLASEKKGVIFVSSDLKELMSVCDRIVVMSNGEISGDFPKGTWTQDKIMKAALSRYMNSQ